LLRNRKVLTADSLKLNRESACANEEKEREREHACANVGEGQRAREREARVSSAPPPNYPVLSI
jgi:hypothetical protein